MAVSATERPIPTGEGLTFEKVWAMFQETDRRFQETDRKFQETRKLQQETDRQISRLEKQMGGLHSSFGELAEHLVAPGIVEKFNKLGYHFDGIAPGGYILHDEKGKELTQIDLYLENGDFIVAVEIKANPKKDDIEHHARRLKLLRKQRDKKNDKRKIRGAIAAAIFPAELKKTALDAGFYVLIQSGDTMKMDIPKNFVPKEW